MNASARPENVPAKVEELAYAHVLEPFTGEELNPGVHEVVHFDDVAFDQAEATASRFIETAFSSVRFDHGRLRRSRFTDVWMHTVRLTGTDVAECTWIDGYVVASLWAGAAAFDSELQRVVFSSCKLNAVNFRAARLFDVVFEDCVLTDVDFGGAELTRVSFPGSALRGVHLAKATLNGVDLRGATELDLASGYGALRGATISEPQLIGIAPALASTMGITVRDR